MPTGCWVEAAESGLYAAITISVPLDSDVPSAATLLTALRSQSVAKVFVGGGAQDQLNHLAEPLGQRFSLAVPTLLAALTN